MMPCVLWCCVPLDMDDGTGSCRYALESRAGYASSLLWILFYLSISL